MPKVKKRKKLMPEEPKKRVRQVIEEVVTPPVDVIPPEPSPVAEETNVGKKPQEDIHEPKEEPKPTSEIYQEKPSLLMLIMITAIVALFVGLTGGGVYVYVTGLSKLKPNQSEQPSSTLPPVPTPSAGGPTGGPTATQSGSPKASLKPSSYKISVLNGSGRVGEAGKAKTLIEKGGFVVGNTGNADSYDFTNTIIQVKDSVGTDVVDALTKALSVSYKVQKGKTLPAGSTYDIVITVGSS